MAAIEGLANLVTLEYSEDSTNGVDGTWKTVVCDETDEGGSSASPTVTKTKCAVFVAPGVPEGTVTGSGVTSSNPDSNEASFNDIQKLIWNSTKVWARYSNVASADGTVSAGSLVNMWGQGYFTDAKSTNQSGDVSKFSWSFAFSGDVDVNPNS